MKTTETWPRYSEAEIADADTDGTSAIAVIREVTARDRARSIAPTLADIDDGTGTLGTIIEQAIADAPSTSDREIRASVRAIVAEAIEDAAAA